MTRSQSYCHIRLALLTALGLSACGRPPSGGEEAGEDGTGSSASDTRATESGSADTDSGSSETGSSGCGVCEGSEPIFQNDGYTGFNRCPDGTVHRCELGTCDPTNDAPACNGDEPQQSCSADADCVDGPNGRCVHYDGFKSPEGSCGCQYSCETDADCGAGQACICSGLDADSHNRSICLDVHCLTGDGCASGECGLAAYNDGCGPVVTLQCRADDDACRVDGDCDDDPMGEFCAIPWGASEWQCATYDCAAGRPYTVEGEARTAPVIDSADWSAPEADTAPLFTSKEEAAELAAYWSKLASFEHASVASFNRFALQLLGLGAPPELLYETQVASADEVRHAQLAFGLASRYAGEPIGPGPMRIEAEISLDVERIMRGLIEEGCVGETLGVIEAESAAKGCRDRSVQRILEEIASDELRHAELAWKSLRWMLETDASLTPLARQVFADALARERAKASRGVHLPHHGVISGPARERIIQAGIDEVLAPLVDALFS